MLLHNLYWLTNFRYPENIEFIYGTNRPIQVVARNQITCSSPVNISGSSVELVSGGKILLMPGFSVNVGEGSNFKTRIVDGMAEGEVPLIFEEVSLDDYPGCNTSLKSMKAKLSNKKSTSDITEISDNTISFYPNPCSNQVFVKSSPGYEIRRVEICNALHCIKQYIFSDSSNLLTLEISDLSAGLYFIKIFDTRNRIYHHKIVKQ